MMEGHRKQHAFAVLASGQRSRWIQDLSPVNHEALIPGQSTHLYAALSLGPTCHTAKPFCDDQGSQTFAGLAPDERSIVIPQAWKQLWVTQKDLHETAMRVASSLQQSRNFSLFKTMDLYGGERVRTQNFNMLLLRYRLMRFVGEWERTLRISYASFLYVREDNYFFRQPEIGALLPLPPASVAHSKFCFQEGHMPDKIFLAGRRAMHVYLAETFNRFQDNVVLWLTYGKYPQTEGFYQALATRHRLNTSTLDFHRNDARVIDGCTCTIGTYAPCAWETDLLPLCPDAKGKPCLTR